MSLPDSDVRGEILYFAAHQPPLLSDVTAYVVSEREGLTNEEVRSLATKLIRQLLGSDLIYLTRTIESFSGAEAVALLQSAETWAVDTIRLIATPAGEQIATVRRIH